MGAWIRTSLCDGIHCVVLGDEKGRSYATGDAVRGASGKRDGRIWGGVVKATQGHREELPSCKKGANAKAVDRTGCYVSMQPKRSSGASCSKVDVQLV